jgi:hypothetical protein
MKKIFFLVYLLSVVLIYPAAVSAAGNISVSSTPSGALVLLDGTGTGTTTPIIIESVTGGSHVISLRLTGYQDYSKSVTVFDNTTSTASAVLTALTTTVTAAITNGSISVESSPSDASVFLNTEYQGKTPLTLYNISHGYYRIVVQKTGYHDWSNRISVSTGILTDVYATLTAEEPETALLTTIPTTTVLKTLTTKKSTAIVPTSWPVPATTTTPVEIIVIPGATVLAYMVIRKR